MELEIVLNLESQEKIMVIPLNGKEEMMVMVDGIKKIKVVINGDLQLTINLIMSGVLKVILKMLKVDGEKIKRILKVLNQVEVGELIRKSLLVVEVMISGIIKETAKMKTGEVGE